MEFNIDFNKFASMVPIIGQTTLKDLIKQIRLCKTQADERAVIQKESATIRTAFKEESNFTRYINIEKLLYIHMLGYPAHFGQIECLKLAASPRFSDKKLAYLGIMLLLDENQETLTLVTNCLKNDMNNSNVYIVGLALCTLGNIASAEMARDLSMEVERLLTNNSSYLRKKAALTAMRIIRKVPDLIDHFSEYVPKLLNEKNHGVLLTSVTLMEQMCALNEECTASFRPHVGTLCRLLKTLVAGGTSPEHEVNGITDPFLQVKILRLLRRLGKSSVEASEQMNDILAQVATTTESSKNVGNAVLYESVLTIMDIESDSSLRVLGINILGRFLQNKDNNIKYVALTTMTKVAIQVGNTDISALQRHRSTVIDCLRDTDISIRKRALDLAFHLITPQNIRILTRELLTYLENCENESKPSIASRICENAGNFRPNKRWEIDTIIRVLRVAGKYIDQGVINHFVKLVTTGESAEHQYTVQKLYGLIKEHDDTVWMQIGLLQAALWCCGEYGDLLVTKPISNPILEEDDDKASPTVVPTEQEVVHTISSILKENVSSSEVCEYGLTALAKLSVRFRDEIALNQIQTFNNSKKDELNIEIQQRAVEYDQLFGMDKQQRFALLERMPVLESAKAAEELKGKGAPIEPTKAARANLLGESLLGESKSADPNNIMDLLGGLNISNTPATPTPAQPTAAVDLLGDLFGTAPAQPVQPAQPKTLPPVQFYNKHNLVVEFTPLKESSTMTQVKAVFKSTDNIKNIMLQIAVPKSFKLMLQPASGSEVSLGQEITQLFKLENPSKQPIRLRIKISFVGPLGPVEEVVDFSSFDAHLWT